MGLRKRNASNQNVLESGTPRPALVSASQEILESISAIIFFLPVCKQHPNIFDTFQRRGKGLSNKMSQLTLLIEQESSMGMYCSPMGLAPLLMCPFTYCPPAKCIYTTDNARRFLKHILTEPPDHRMRLWYGHIWNTVKLACSPNVVTNVNK